jgi:hypothetical protein
MEQRPGKINSKWTRKVLFGVEWWEKRKKVRRVMKRDLLINHFRVSTYKRKISCFCTYFWTRNGGSMQGPVGLAVLFDRPSILDFFPGTWEHKL